MRVVRRICSAAGTLLITGIVFLAIALVGVRLVGLTPYAVLSGSMEPTYHVGSLIYVKKAAPEEISIGDSITFVMNADLMVATHRVVDMAVYTETEEEVLDEAGEPVLNEETGEALTAIVTLDEPVYRYTTKGDANDAADGGYVDYRNVLGKPVFSIPYLGYFSSWIQSPRGMILAACGMGVLLILLFLPDMLRAADESDRKAKKRRKKKKRKAAGRADVRTSVSLSDEHRRAARTGE